MTIMCDDEAKEDAVVGDFSRIEIALTDDVVAITYHGETAQVTAQQARCLAKRLLAVARALEEEADPVDGCPGPELQQKT